MQGRRRGRSDLRPSAAVSALAAAFPGPRGSAKQRYRSERGAASARSAARQPGLRPAGAGAALPGAVYHRRPGPPPNGPERRGSAPYTPAGAAGGRAAAGRAGPGRTPPRPRAAGRAAPEYPPLRPGGKKLRAAGGPPRRRSRVPPRRAGAGRRAGRRLTSLRSGCAGERDEGRKG